MSSEPWVGGGRRERGVLLTVFPPNLAGQLLHAETWTWTSLPESRFQKRTCPKCGISRPCQVLWKREPRFCGTPKTRITHSSLLGGSPGAVFVKLFCNWRNGIFISYELELLCQMCLVPARGLDTPSWPCPGRKGRAGGARRAQDFPGVAEPSCVGNNKTKETCACVDGACVLARVLPGDRFLFPGAPPTSSSARTSKGIVSGLC